jgi:hypothetical protein
MLDVLYFAELRFHVIRLSTPRLRRHRRDESTVTDDECGVLDIEAIGITIVCLDSHQPQAR